MSIILFEDDRVEWLHPITIGKPAMAISCGSYRLIDLVGRLGHPVRWIIREHLREIQAANYALEGRSRGGATRPLLLVNAALVPSAAVGRRLAAILEAGLPGIVRTQGRVAAALLAPDSPPPPDDGCTEEL